VEKVIKNLCVFLCQDDSHTPLFSKHSSKEVGILSFNKEIATAVSSSVGRHKDEPVEEPKEIVALRVMRRGGVASFTQLTIKFGPTLFDKVPKIWQCVSEDLLKVYPSDATATQGDEALEGALGQSFLDTLTALRDIAPTLDPTLVPQIKELFPCFLLGIQSRFSVIRQAVAKCFAVVCNILTPEVMLFLVNCILPLADDAKEVKNRQGAIELIFRENFLCFSSQPNFGIDECT
jgi:TATA-binding protein-associated factor